MLLTSLPYELRIACLFFALIFCCTACDFGTKSVAPDVSEVKIDWKWQRFDKDLFAIDTMKFEAQADELLTQYPAFAPFYAGDLLEIGPPELKNRPLELLKFYAGNPDTRALFDSCQLVFGDMEQEEAEFNRAFRLYKHYFGNDRTPSVILHTSAFGPMAFTLGKDILGVNLEMFLGKDFSLYPTAGFPAYLSYSFEKECLAPMSMKAWLNEQFPAPIRKVRFVDQLVHNGKILYLLDLLLPDKEDRFKIGYPQEKLEWCNEDEDQIWAFFIEKKLLYETRSNKYINYITEGPTSAGMPFESPGNVGSWVGWQIVRKFMERNPDVSIPKLMEIDDGQEILSRSKYKPN